MPYQMPSPIGSTTVNGQDREACLSLYAKAFSQNAI